MASSSDLVVLDTRKIATGKDGRLFCGVGQDTPQFLAECGEWSAKLNVKNTDFQPVGSGLVVAVPTGFSVTLTMTETVVRDDVMLEPLITALQKGIIPWYTMNCGITRAIDDQEERMTFNQCVPDGDIDLASLKPGEIIQRSWSFRVNMLPQFQKLFAYEGKYNSEYTHYQG
ncbi:MULTISPECIES: hypothetical protein [Caproicibacterium]|uniref:Uncharacterized protein n=1 Tax=Caproicibacterium argilliputei TaxID=3030016 RepID=A0AA97H2C0_9FIRM|nr:hypothetical protein [Caproicibacterium argilliputei]WOC33481.1 hypothetical protein PXC00_06335 [Caproicibacterium argilliputei]